MITWAHSARYTRRLLLLTRGVLRAHLCNNCTAMQRRPRKQVCVLMLPLLTPSFRVSASASHTHLSLAEVERGGELDALGRGEVALLLEAALEALQLHVREDGARLAAAVRLARVEEAACAQPQRLRVDNVPRERQSCRMRGVLPRELRAALPPRRRRTPTHSAPKRNRTCWR